MPASSRVLPTRGGRTQGRSRAPGSNSGSVGSATVRVTPYGRHHASVRRTPARDCAEWHQHGSPSNESSRSSRADSPASIRRLRGADRPSIGRQTLRRFLEGFGRAPPVAPVLDRRWHGHRGHGGRASRADGTIWTHGRSCTEWSQPQALALPVTRPRAVGRVGLAVSSWGMSRRKGWQDRRPSCCMRS